MLIISRYNKAEQKIKIFDLTYYSFSDILNIEKIKDMSSMLSFCLSLIETDQEKLLIEELYNKNKQTMYNIAYSNLHNRADAEDAVHEAILRAINQIKKLSQISSDKQCTYLNVIVRNISFDMFNRRVNNLSLEEDAEIYDQTVLEDQAIGNVNYDLLVDFIRSLPQGMRDAMYLKYCLDFTNEEIEQALNISPSALRNRLFTARKRIKDYIRN